MLALDLSLEAVAVLGETTPFATFALADDFEDSTYWQRTTNTGTAGQLHTSPSTLVGYAYTGVGDPTIDSSGYTVATDVKLSHDIHADSSAIADADMLMFVRGTPSDLSGSTVQYALEVSDGTANNRAILYVNPTNDLVNALVVSGGVSVYSFGVDGAITATEVTMILRRLNGQWRVGKYFSGALSWRDAATAAFPSGMTKICAGNSLSAARPFLGDIADARIRIGTFSTDGDVLGAIAV